MGSGSSHCRQCQQDVDSYGNVQVEHQLFCDLWYKANRIWIEPDLDGLYDMSQPDMDRMYDLEQTIEGQNRTIKDLRSQIGSNVASNSTHRFEMSHIPSGTHRHSFTAPLYTRIKSRYDLQLWVWMG